MKWPKLPTSVTRGFNRVKLAAGEKSPEIAGVIGVISIVGSIATAIRGTIKFVESFHEYEEELEKIERLEERKAAGTTDKELLAIDLGKARTAAKVKLVKSGVKCYLPTVIFGATGIGAFEIAAGIWKGRAITYAGVASTALADKAFLENGVREKYGEEALRSLLTEKVDGDIVAHVDEKTGEVVEESGPKYEYHSQFSKFFDEASPHWVKNAEDNRFFLQKKEEMANWLLEQKGFLKLNEVYTSLGIPNTKAGEIYGWIWKPGKLHQVSFGIFDVGSLAARNFVNGFERSILLDFNCEKEPIIGRLPLDDK